METELVPARRPVVIQHHQHSKMVQAAWMACMAMHRLCTLQVVHAALLFIYGPVGSTFCGEVARTSFRKRSPVSAFFYTMYGTPEDNAESAWSGWNPLVQPHWNDHVNQQARFKDMIGTRYSPPENIGSRFYPSGGPYSSESLTIIRRQFKQMQSAGAPASVRVYTAIEMAPCAF
eukprot:SAG31_NODE_11242_length_1050_cov_1.724501_1_plen_175_part_00